jgi:hypothetical protein
MSALALIGSAFLREHLRERLTLALLVLIPATFVVASAAVLGEFADALGGDIAGRSTSALGAGWAAAFLAGTIGFFQISSAREADRRLALAGMGVWRVTAGRIGAALVLAVLVSAVAFVTLWIRAGVEHPAHTFAAIGAFAAIYVGIGALVGAFVTGALEGSLTVAMVFLVDAFSGPGMTDSGGVAVLAPTRNAAELLIDAGAGQGSPVGDWLVVGATVLGLLTLAMLSFRFAARGGS